MNWFDYRERLGIGFNDDHMLGILKKLIYNGIKPLYAYYDNNALLYYSNTIGLRFDEFRAYGSDPLKGAMADIAISDSIADYVSRFVVVINSCEHGNPKLKEHKDDFCNLLCSTLEKCRIPFECISDNEGVFIFPKGVPEFDRNLVSENLLWLSKYPETEKAWIQALRDYSSGKEPSEVADKFRKALERFFQNFFSTEKTLENLKQEYGKYLKGHGVPSEIANNL